MLTLLLRRAFAAGRDEACALPREEIEKPGALRFVGLVVLENKLKPQSASVISQLQRAEIACVMVTGDHAMTAVTVARAANIIEGDAAVVLCDAPGAQGLSWLLLEGRDGPEAPLGQAEALRMAPECRYVVTGSGFDALLASSEAGDAGPLGIVLSRVAVAARYQPLQKQRIIELLMERGHVAAFVGDGANDSAALKAADVGLSLTADAEASVAAPFTAKNAALESILTLLLEGRAAICTGFQLFKFMALYAAVQFSNSLMMDLSGTYLSEYEFLYVDTLLVLPLSMVLPHTRAWTTLEPRKPVSSLLHWNVLTSVFGQAAICVAFQLAVRAAVTSQCWYLPQNYQCCPAGGAAPPPMPPPLPLLPAAAFPPSLWLSPSPPLLLAPPPAYAFDASCPARQHFEASQCVVRGRSPGALAQSRCDALLRVP